MWKFYIFLIILLITTSVNAQVNVTATAGTIGPASYSTLSTAFAAINAGTHQGAIVVDVTSSFTDVAISVLNSSGAGSALYSSILIRPTADTVTISFASSTGRGVIELNGADNITIDGDNPNTPGINRNLSISNIATNAITFTSVIRFALSNSLVLTCDNDTIRNCNLSGSGYGMNTAASVSEITTWGVVVTGGATGTTSAPAPLTSAGTTIGQGATATNLSISNNNINTVARGVSISGATPTMALGLLISNNVIGNSVAGNADQVWAMGITVQGANSAMISGNTIYLEGYINNTNVNKAIDIGTLSVTASGSGVIIENNIIARAWNNHPQGWAACGVNINGGTGHIIRNNFIFNLMNKQSTGTGSFSSSIGVYGIRIAGGTDHFILHNSVHLYGALPASTGLSLTAAFIITSTTQTGLKVKNNIFSNILSGGNSSGSRNVSVYLPVSGTSNMNIDWNNNAYFGSADVTNRLAQVGATFGTGEYPYTAFDPSSILPMANFRSVSATLNNAGSNDNASYSSLMLAPFMSSSDLHIPNGTATLLESTGAPAGVTTDIDRQNRNTTTPDIGADEFNGTYIDPIPPVINFIPLTNSSCTSAPRNFVATIFDSHSGLNINPGTRPRIWFKKLTNANVLPVTNDNTSNGWKYVESGSASNPFSVSINPALIFGGVVTGDIIQYFIVAQDLASVPNVAISSGSFANNPSNVALQANSFPLGGIVNSYMINAPGISGTVTIGATGNYPSLTGTGGLFETLNNSGLSGNLTARIADVAVNETGAIALNQVADGCGGPFVLTIKPASGSNVILSGSLDNGALLKIFSDNVIIDGSNNGSNSRDLTLANTSTAGPTVVLFGSSGVIPVANSGLKNCIVINGTNEASAVIASDGNAIASPGYFNHITIQNNSIQRAYIGCYVNAVTATGNGNGLVVAGNDLTAAGVNSIRLVGLYLQGVEGATVTDNMMSNFDNFSDPFNFTGIWLATGATNTVIANNTISNMTGGPAPRGIAISTGMLNSNIIIRDNTISGLISNNGNVTAGIFVFSATNGVTILRNKISNIKNIASNGGANGISLSSSLAPANVNVYNNFISDVTAVGSNGFLASNNGYGIIIISGNGYNIDHNTVWLNTNQTATNGLPAAMNITNGVVSGGVINIRNNIFVNTQTVGTNRYAIMHQTATAYFGVINNNAYYSTGANIARALAANCATLASLQAQFQGNAASIIYQPTFVSADDLHLANTPGANWCLDGKGLNLLNTIPGDIDNTVRNNPPDIGADEFDPAGFITNNPAAVCPGVVVDLTAPSITAGSGSGLMFTYFMDAAATIPLTNPNAVTMPGTYYIMATNGSCSIIKPVAVTQNPVPAIITQPVSLTTCSENSVTFTAIASNAVSYQWQLWDGAGWNNINNAISSGYTITNPAANMNSNLYRVAITNVCTVISNQVSLTVNSLPQVNILVSPYSNLLPGQTTTISSSVNPAGGSYLWYNNGVVFANGVPQLSNLTVSNQGNFKLVYTDLNRCMNSSTEVILSSTASNRIYLYPNPAKNKFFVRFYNRPGESITLNMYDEKGAKVFTKQQITTLAYTIIDVNVTAGFANGTYLVEILNQENKQVGTAKVIIAN